MGQLIENQCGICHKPVAQFANVHAECDWEDE